MKIMDWLFSRMGAAVKRDNKIGFVGDRLPDEEDLDDTLDAMRPDPPNWTDPPRKKLDIIVMGKEKK